MRGGFELAASDAELVEKLELTPQIGAAYFAAQELAVAGGDANNFVGLFVRKLHTEIARAMSEKADEELGTGLGAVVENGVAAASVGLERELCADTVAELHLVFVAGATAVAVVFPLGEKRAEHAMLHVKQRHVLMEREVEPAGRGRDKQ